MSSYKLGLSFQVIQIASIVSIAGRGADEPPLMKSVLTLNTCAPIIGVHVVSCKTEVRVMMCAWTEKDHKSENSQAE